MARGRSVLRGGWVSSPVPLTLALSLRERENVTANQDFTRIRP